MTMAPTGTTEFTVNGQAVTVGSQHPHLLAALREELDVTSPKDGCSPSGQCGACTVLLDGKPIQSCLVSLEKASGNVTRAARLLGLSRATLDYRLKKSRILGRNRKGRPRV